MAVVTVSIEEFEADFLGHCLKTLDSVVEKLENAESNKACLEILMRRLEVLRIILDGPGRKMKIDLVAKIFSLIQSAEMISNMYCYDVSKTYMQHAVKAGKVREEIQHLVEHMGLCLCEMGIDNCTSGTGMHEDSLRFDAAELKDNSAIVLSLQNTAELEDTDMLDSVVEEYRARNSLIVSCLHQNVSVGGDPKHRAWALRLEEVSVFTPEDGSTERTLAADRFRGAPVILKSKSMSPSAPIDARALKLLPFELSVLFKLRHPNVCGCVGASVGFQHPSAAAQPFYTLLLEWHSHTLRDEIERPGHYPGSLLRDYGPASDEQRVQIAQASAAAADPPGPGPPCKGPGSESNGGGRGVCVCWGGRGGGA